MGPRFVGGAEATFLLIYRRAIRYTLRNPMWVWSRLVQPFLFSPVVFGPLLVRLNSSPGNSGHNSWQVFVPGLLIQQALFSCAFVGYGILSGAPRRLARPAENHPHQPVRAAGRPGGPGLYGAAKGAALLTGGALLMGLRAPIAGIAVAWVLVGCWAPGSRAFSYGLALRLGNEEVFSSMLNGLLLPILLLSGVLLPMMLAPTWLSWLSKANPLSRWSTRSGRRPG